MAQITGENVEKELNIEKIDINSKRKEYLSWEDYFMATAFLAAQRSKDPSSQVGACIVNDENKIVGVGYNGMPTGCDDEELPWSRVGETYLDTKYAYGKKILSFSYGFQTKSYAQALTSPRLNTNYYTANGVFLLYQDILNCRSKHGLTLGLGFHSRQDNNIPIMRIDYFF